jgi:hypothetical protein
MNRADTRAARPARTKRRWRARAGRLGLGLGLGLGTAFGLAGAGTDARAAEPRSFDALVEAATPIADLGPLVSPFVDDCGKRRREIDRARCRGMGDFLREALPRRTFVMEVDDPGALELSAYDARVRGFHLRVAGCLDCDEGVPGADGAPRFVTVRPPGKGEDLHAATEVARPVVAFPSVAEATRWAAGGVDRLRLEVVFQASGEAFSHAAGKGVAFKLLGTRVHDRCTGEVLYASPPPRERRLPVRAEAGCAGGGDEGGGAAGGARLGPEAINGTISGAREAFAACDRQHGTAGTANLDFLVGPNGQVLSVRVVGRLDGTAVSRCLVEAAGALRFPAFVGQAQRFQYPVILKGK